MMRISAVLAFFMCAGGLVVAQQSQEQLEQRIEQLERELQELKAQVAKTPPPGAQQPTAPPTAAPSEKQKTEAEIEETPSEKSEEAIEAAKTEEQKKAEEGKSKMEIYGFAMLDTGYQAGASDPAWFDVMRTTKLPSFAGEFGKGGRWYSGVRQSRLGVKTSTPTKFGDLKTIFEFELFGVGVDAGQTTFRLRHAWGEIGQVGAGQTWSPFMDPDVFPNSLEYWGPAGMVFFRNVQFRWTPYKKKGTEFMVAIERPGASGDPGTIAGRVAIANAQGRFPAPDFSSRLRVGGERGHFQIATILRYMKWDDTAPLNGIDEHGNAVGWGVNLSGNYIFNNKKDTLRLQAVYGKGIQNYMNDSPVDVGAFFTGNLVKPVDGRPLAELGLVAFLDHSWGDRFSSTVGYSLNDVENSGLQAPSAFSRGQYALFNTWIYPVKNAAFGGEFQWGRRANFQDHFIYDDYRVQFGAKYNFSFNVFGGDNK